MTKIICDECGGVGELEDRKGKLYTCPTCKGRGYEYTSPKQVASETTNVKETEESK